MKTYISILLLFALALTHSVRAQETASQTSTTDNPPIYIAFLWHMHQPLYWPGETILETETGNYYPYSVFDIHNSRTGPYTNWPKNAVQKGIDANLEHSGAQVSFSGSLIENLNLLSNNGNGNFVNWTSHWNSVINQTTELGNPRMDMIGFGYFHPLMGLIEYQDIRTQIQLHKQIMSSTFDGTYSKGIFPPENAFSTDMIPALVDEGIEWVLVDNIHFERAAQGYPFNTGGNLYEANKADVLNENPQDWIQLNGLWAPTQISAQWARQPHYVQYTDPESGETTRMIAVPTDRYMGNEDGRGGFGALNYEAVMSQLEAYNTDPDHPILIVLHHDGDNFGGGSESYYNSNFQAFTDWAANNRERFVPTTIQDYIDQFPPDENDIIHIESGSWSGADNGDPEFKKWLGDPDPNTGYSPDRNSWGVVTAAKNYVDQALANNPGAEATQNAQRLLMNAQASDYWYWDNSIDGVWDTHPTTASNLAINELESSVTTDNDAIPPTIFKPQREPYNPGGFEWEVLQPSDFEVWTYVYDVSGLEYVNLKYKALDQNNWLQEYPITFSDVDADTSWKEIPMAGVDIESNTNAQPLRKALEYSATLYGVENAYVAYFVEAGDTKTHRSRSLIQYVWVGQQATGGGNGGGGNPTTGRLTISPENPTPQDSITIRITEATQGAKLHWGVNGSGSNWETPSSSIWPDATELFNGDGPAVESSFLFDADSAILTLTLPPVIGADTDIQRLVFVIHYEDDTWDNNAGKDYQITFSGSANETHTFVMDGVLDNGTQLAATQNEQTLRWAYQEPFLYVATESANNQPNDVFIVLHDGENDGMIQAPWSKNGTVSAWFAFLANEQSNGFNDWYETQASEGNSSGTVLEGVLNLSEAFSTLPSSLYAAVLEYGTDDNGDLVNQVPAGNDDDEVELAEFAELNLSVINSNESRLTPETIELYQNYPNPFNPTTAITFRLDEAATVQLQVFDVLGRLVATLADGRVASGLSTYTFDAANLSSGVYFYTLSVNDARLETRKMLLLK
ncbi:MAG: T9SS type A sorting domain-containing protein [Bacteroidota bacterium]